mmetsp:Transcript_52708/g.94094  ORF Transcript_52708/g.94094 Transcript_52708/m.94094 type:complete len:99 (-) Transcript_52708:239-535(-)
MSYRRTTSWAPVELPDLELPVTAPIPEEAPNADAKEAADDSEVQELHEDDPEEPSSGAKSLDERKTMDDVAAPATATPDKEYTATAFHPAFLPRLPTF